MCYLLVDGNKKKYVSVGGEIKTPIIYNISTLTFDEHNLLEKHVSDSVYHFHVGSSTVFLFKASV